MRTNLLSFVMESKNRKQVVTALFEHPKRLWSCSALEETIRMPHATVFRTLHGLVEFGILKTMRINRKDIVYELVQNSLWVKELQRTFQLDKIVAKKVALAFVTKIKSTKISSIIQYGSSVSGEMNPNSDIDLLVILKKQDKRLELKLLDAASRLSSEVNRTISATIMSSKEVQTEKNLPFLKSVKANHEVLYGKTPF
ncbi:nucleotidyltransferase domain-containing protein [Candidatus Woesearchaeota archaeon]|nr:nucleotidyltransferase domain-containing protein [Candidatus Woesearchaeota archaeon]